MTRWTFALAALGLFAPPARASEDLRDKIGELAKKTLEILNNSPKSVKVGKFALSTGVPDHVTSEAGMRQLVTQELNARQPGVVKDDSPLVLNGTVKYVSPDGNENNRIITIDAQVESELTGRAIELNTINVTVDSNKAIREVLQATGPRPTGLDPAKERAEVNAQTIQDVKKPAAAKAGTRVASKKGQPFEIEILKQPVADVGKKKPALVAPEIEKGLAFVAIDRDDVYEVRVHNGSDREIAVAVTIDGIDMFHFSRDRLVKKDGKDEVVLLKEADPLVGRPRFTHWIMGAVGESKVLDVPGWHYAQAGTDNFRSFLVTAYGQGAHSKAGIATAGDLGTIHVRFFACSPPDANSNVREGEETGFGPSKTVATKAVKYGVGVELDSISVRYRCHPKK